MKTKKYNINDLVKYADGKSGKCLSVEYKNKDTKYSWQCEFGHVWESSWGKINNYGSWCHKCGGSERHNIDMLQSYAKSFGGKCISNEYQNQKHKYSWQCEFGHVWESSWDSIKQSKHFCPECTKCKYPTKYSIDNLKKYAEEKEGECLSKKYKNTNTIYQWKCKCKNVWYASWSSVVYQNSWCPECANNVKYTIEDLKKHALLQRGLFLSKEYVTVHTSYQWQCEFGHVWESSWHQINTHGSWCHKCSKSNRESKGEKKCREIFEQIFNKSFPTKRPDFLKNPKSGYNLELDGYNAELKIAFEYDGEQHFKPIEIFGGIEKLKNTNKLDLIKNDLCKKHGVVLIRIPYSIEYKNLTKYIIQELKNENIRY